mmetsp:Transcript_27649/g.82812  ORF Transcript_27649/g.82812 Transcript_27649/m.82812 type:complete len:208 (-) Transcript_27649:399-1022(-)
MCAGFRRRAATKSAPSGSGGGGASSSARSMGSDDAVPPVSGDSVRNAKRSRSRAGTWTDMWCPVMALVHSSCRPSAEKIASTSRFSTEPKYTRRQRSRIPSSRPPRRGFRRVAGAPSVVWRVRRAVGVGAGTSSRYTVPRRSPVCRRWFRYVPAPRPVASKPGRWHARPIYPAEHPRPGRGGARDPSPRNIHVAAAASTTSAQSSRT